MKLISPIKLYGTRTFTDKFMPSDELHGLLKDDYDKFLIVPVEDMYRHVSKPVPPSRATSHTFIYLTEGEAYMKIGSELYTIHQDEMLFVPAGQVFSFEAYDDSKYNKGFLCNFHNDVLIRKSGSDDFLKAFEFLQVWGNPYIHLDGTTSIFVLQLLKRLYADYSQNGLSRIDIIQAYLFALLTEIKQVYKPLFNNNHTAAFVLTNKFRQLLYKHIKEKHLVSEYAALLNVTPNHLNKAVRTVTSKSPTKWIDEAIVLEAKVLLYQTGFSINEISATIGIEDPSYFSRLFKKYEGATPLAFRKLIETS